MKSKRQGGILLLAIGVMLMAAVLVPAFGSAVRGGVEVQAEIVSLEARVSGTTAEGENEYDYTTTFLYTYDGQEYVVSSGVYNSFWEKGDTCTLYIDPADPYRIQEKGTLGIMLALCVPAGILCVIWGARTLWPARREGAQNPESGMHP